MLGICLFTVKIIGCKFGNGIGRCFPLGQEAKCSQTDGWRDMKFAGKYELHESVTSGPVETFVAHALATNERVLVHVFECRDQKSDRPTIVRVLEAFRAVAPDPLGTVVDAGQYGDTSYVYLVTKVPKDVDLQRWLHHYERDFARSEHSRSAGSPQDPGTRGQFTQAFEAFQEGPGLGKGVTGAVERVPGSNTESQMSAMKESSVVGEFTKYFRGPFDGNPALTPDIPEPLESPQQPAGEFTRLFGPEKKDSAPEPIPLLNDPPQNYDRSEFTQSERLSNSSVIPKPPLTSESRRSAASVSSGIPEPVWDSGVPATVNTPPTPPPRPTPTPRPNAEGGYTEIIRRAELPPALEEEPVKAAAGEKTIESKVPSPPPAPAGKPSVQLSQAPKVAVPPLDGEAAARPVSYWPLILIWVISFFLAALVVLFFALKR
jgi:hypothetical protein